MFRKKKSQPDDITNESPTSPRLTHEDLISELKEFGYKDVSKEGVCRGYEVMCMQAFHSGDRNTFRERLNFIAEHPKFKSDYELLKEKRQNTQLTDVEEELFQKYSDAAVFLNGLYVYQYPAKNSQLFKQGYTQRNIQAVSVLMNSIAIENKGGLVTLDSHVDLYSQQSMEEYLKELAAILKKHNQEAYFSIGSGSHAIGLCFIPEGEKGSWSVVDANHMYFPDVSVAYGSHMVAKAVCEFAYLLDSSQPDDQYVLNFQPTTTAHQAPLLNAALDEFKNTETFKRINKLTQEKIYFKRSDGRGKNFLALAVYNGDINTVLEIVKQDPSALKSMEKPVLRMAVTNNHAELLEELAKMDIKLNQRLNGLDTGRTIAHIAAKTGNVKILRILDFYGVNLKQKSLSVKDLRNTPLDFAKKFNRIDAIKFIESVNKRDALIAKISSLETKVNDRLAHELTILRQNILNHWHGLVEESKHGEFDDAVWIERIKELIKSKIVKDRVQTPAMYQILKSPSITDPIKKTETEIWSSQFRSDYGYRTVQNEKAKELLANCDFGTYLVYTLKNDDVMIAVVDNNSNVRNLVFSYQEYANCGTVEELFQRYINLNPESSLRGLELHPMTNRIMREPSAGKSREIEENHSSTEERGGLKPKI